MKVIKVGIWNKKWVGKYICKTCQAELLVEETDLEPQGNEIDFNFYHCPECRSQNYIDKSQLPLRVLDELNKKRKYWNSGDPF